MATNTAIKGQPAEQSQFRKGSNSTLHMGQMTSSMQIRASTGLQKSLLAGLKELGVDVQAALVDGNVEAIAQSIQAVGRARRAISRPVIESAPSDERARKGRTIERGKASRDGFAHQILSPIVELKRQRYLNDDEFAAAERFRVAHETLHRSQGVANWSGVGGSGGARLEMTERQQIAGQELARAYVALGKGSVHAAAVNFILEMPAPGHSSVLGWYDFAKTQIAVVDEVPARHFAYGWLHTACQSLAAVYSAIDAERTIDRRYQRLTNAQQARGA